MKYILPILAVALLVLVSAPAMAATGIPGDANEDDTLTQQELATYIISCMEGQTKAEDAQDAAHVYAYWDGKPRSIVDASNTTVTIYKPVKKIVSSSTGCLKTICIFKQEDGVVGVPQAVLNDPLMYPRLQDKANVGSTDDPDYEKIVELGPDVYITSATTHTGSNTARDVLDPMGITVVMLDLTGSKGDDVYEKELHQLGYLLDSEERADSFINWKKSILALIQNRTADIKVEDRPRVIGLYYSTVNSGDADLSQGHAPKKIIQKAGGTDMSTGFPSGTKISGEWIIKNGPDAILIEYVSPAYGFGYNVTNTTIASESLEKALEHPAIKATNASKNGQVYLYGYYGVGQGDQLEVGALFLAKKLYPERFSDIDPEQYHREYFEQWLGIPYSGVWFYP